MPALDGMRILDLTQYEAGTSCTQALAWLGADVVKVERPGSGDPGRASFEDYGSEESDYFLNWNCNKRSITIALDQPEGRALLLRLVPRFDVFVENFGPGVVEKLDLDYDAVRQANPGIIYGRIKGFGSSGPYSDYKCFDPVALAAGGAFSVTGEAGGPPMAPGPTIGDSGTGVQMALALVAAYVQKLRTGEGQLVEISMQEAVTYFMRTMIALGSKRGTRATPRRGSGMGALTRLYPCAPGGPNDYVYIMAITPRMWQGVCDAIGRAELAQRSALRDRRAASRERGAVDRGDRGVDQDAHQGRGDAPPGRSRRAGERGARHGRPAHRSASDRARVREDRRARDHGPGSSARLAAAPVAGARSRWKRRRSSAGTPTRCCEASSS